MSRTGHTPRALGWPAVDQPRAIDDLSVESRHLQAADGGISLLTIVTASDAAPTGAEIVLLHGMFTDRRFWLSDDGVGLAGALARRGHRVYLAQRRGLGRDTPAPGARRGLTEQIRYDLPALQALIAAESSRPVFWGGHSFGAFAAARAVAETLDPGQVAGLLILACQFDLAKPMLGGWGSWLTRMAIWRWRRLPAKIAGIGPISEPPSAALDAIDWTSSARRQPVIRDALGAITVPVLALVGRGDKVDPPDGCRRFVDYMTSRDATFMIAGRTNGFAADYSHAGLVIDRAARADVWPRIAAWIEARVPTD